MEQDKTERTPFIGYEYKEITVNQGQVSMYIDCYENFGWTVDEKASGAHSGMILRMKRDRKIINRMELTRLQQNFEACANEISILEQSRTRVAAAWALTVGGIGTAFIAGSTFAVTHEPPIIWLCIALAVPGLAGWVLPYFIYHYMVGRQAKKVQPLIEAKQNEIYEVCEKGHSLL